MRFYTTPKRGWVGYVAGKAYCPAGQMPKRVRPDHLRSDRRVQVQSAMKEWAHPCR